MKNKINILAVDDDPDILIVLNEYLYSLGYINVYNAGNGLEALDILSKEKIQLALIDINMPKLNGIELISAMSSTDYKGRLCIISDHEESVLSIAQRMASASGLKPAQFIAKDKLSISSLQRYIQDAVPAARTGLRARLAELMGLNTAPVS